MIHTAIFDNDKNSRSIYKNFEKKHKLSTNENETIYNYN